MIRNILSNLIIKENRFILPRYVLVILISFVLGTLALWLLTEKAHWFYLLSAVIGALISIITDFVLNELWTFSHRRQDGFMSPQLLKRLLKHIISKTVGLVIAFAVLALGTQVFRIHYLVSNLAGIAASFLWNYVVSNGWVWAPNGKAVGY